MSDQILSSTIAVSCNTVFSRLINYDLNVTHIKKGEGLGAGLVSFFCDVTQDK